VKNQAVFLIVEDNSDDALLLRLAFNKARIVNPIHVVSSGEEAVSYLNGTGKYANRVEFPLPELVLLDLNMPGMSGLDLLRWLRQDPQLCRLRVIVLSGSDAIRDINDAYAAGANSFLVKPADLDRFVEISKALSGYWVWTDSPPTSSHSDLISLLDEAERRPLPGPRLAI
jgi:CheY-like chemotaxis protein